MLTVQRDRLASILLYLGDKIRVLPFVTPVMGLNTAHKPIPLFDANDRLPMYPQSDALGADPLNSLNTFLVAINSGLKQSPYNENAYLRSKTVIVQSDAAGAIASTALLAAAGAGVKHHIVEMSMLGYVTATKIGAAGILTLSDIPAGNAIQGVGPSATMGYGPFVQDTGATAINVSAANGETTALSTYIITVRYWDG